MRVLFSGRLFFSDVALLKQGNIIRIFYFVSSIIVDIEVVDRSLTIIARLQEGTATSGLYGECLMFLQLATIIIVTRTFYDCQVFVFCYSA